MQERNIDFCSSGTVTSPRTLTEINDSLLKTLPSYLHFNCDNSLLWSCTPLLFQALAIMFKSHALVLFCLVQVTHFQVNPSLLVYLMFHLCILGTRYYIHIIILHAVLLSRVLTSNSSTLYPLTIL